jgi:hypothetical protein
LMNPVECPKREDVPEMLVGVVVCVLFDVGAVVVSMWTLIHSGMTTVRISAWMVTSLVLASSCSLR